MSQKQVFSVGKPEQVALTRRDRELLETLARRVRVLSVSQVARTWWPDAEAPNRAALARLRQLQRNSLITIESAFAHPELPLESPVATWLPSKRAPNFVETSRKVRSRWRGTAVPETIVVITNQAAAEFGGYPSPALRTDEITHDLHLAAVYLVYRRREPELARDWVSERIVRKTRPAAKGPIPDAMIRASSTLRVVEFAGAYSTERLQVFHEFCATRAWPYELW
ncbi:MAG: hypothetical protein JSU08_01345 [Acidobacteria bacterium]|nr:hypothetical protein [Acidobacteriota bacterium]